MDLVTADMAPSSATESLPMSSFSQTLSKPSFSAWRASSRISSHVSSLLAPSLFRSTPINILEFTKISLATLCCHDRLWERNQLSIAWFRPPVVHPPAGVPDDSRLIADYRPAKFLFQPNDRWNGKPGPAADKQAVSFRVAFQRCSAQPVGEA